MQAVFARRWLIRARLSSKYYVAFTHHRTFMTVTSPHILVVGLGNQPAPSTRHSAGHLIVDALASRLGIRMSADKDLGGYQGHSSVLLGNTAVFLTLFKPKALMNISGPSVLRTLRKSVRLPNYLVVIHDSLDHRPQTLSYKFGGSANGHNGVKSVISSLSSMDFHRLRVGIGRDSSALPAVYVLQRFSPQEVEFWRNGKGLDLILRELEKIAGLSDNSGTIK